MNVLGSNGFCACCLLIGTPACLPNERIGVAGAASSKSGLSAFRPGRAILISRRVEITGPEPSHGFGSAMWDAGFPARYGRKTSDISQRRIAGEAASHRWRDLRLVTWRYKLRLLSTC